MDLVLPPLGDMSLLIDIFKGMAGLTFAQWIDFLQLLALVGGGTWALYLFQLNRRREVKVGLQVSSRLVRDYLPERALLLVNVTLTNTSAVLWRYRSAVVTVFDARKLARDGSVRLAAFAQADPFLPVYGIESDSPEAIAEGSPFEFGEDQEISLEPGEQVNSELAFPLESDKLGLMAIKVLVSGLQRNRSSDPYEWATFCYFDPDEAQGSISSPHLPNTMETK